MILVWVLFLGVLVALTAVATLVSKRFRGRSVGRWGRVSVTISAVFTTLVGAAVLFGCHVTCYLAGRFSSRYLSADERLAILEDAVARGEVDPGVAERARKYIKEIR